MSHPIYPEEHLRAKLSKLGIPREKHDLRSMQDMVPARLDAMPFDACDPDVLAEILVYLISRNIVRLPCQCSAAVSLEWGSHICHFYHDPNELLELLASYMQNGLENNEYCVWIIAGALSREQALEAVLKRFPALPAHEDQFELILHDEWYLDAAGNMRDGDEILAAWVEKEQRALAHGYAGLRLTGDTHWLDNKNWSGFIKYECDVNAAVDGSRIKALCTYPRRRSEQEIMEVLSGHQTVLARQDDWWYRIITSQGHAARAVLEAGEGSRE